MDLGPLEGMKIVAQFFLGLAIAASLCLGGTIVYLVMR